MKSTVTFECKDSHELRELVNSHTNAALAVEVINSYLLSGKALSDSEKRFLFDLRDLLEKE